MEAARRAGDYCGDGGAKYQRHHSRQPGPQVIGVDPVQSYSEMTHIKGPGMLNV